MGGVADHEECLTVGVRNPSGCKVIRDWMSLRREGKRVGDCAGRSIVEMMEDELDAIIERLMGEPENEEERGKAAGVSYCIAIARQPYNPDVPAVKNEAMLRWEARMQEDE